MENIILNNYSWILKIKLRKICNKRLICKRFNIITN